MSGWMLWRLKSDFFLKAAPSMGFFGAQGAPGLFCYLFYAFLKFIFIPLTRLPFLSSLKIFSFSFDALRPRRAPTFWPAESRQRLAKEGCAPFGIPPLRSRWRGLRPQFARGE